MFKQVGHVGLAQVWYEVAHFLRFRLALLLSFIGIAGFLLFHEPSGGVFWAWAASFLVCAGSCALNNKSDVAEDAANRRRVSPLVYDRRGWVLIACALALGWIAAIQLSWFSAACYTIVMVSGILYSGLRLKRFTALKNFNSGFVVPVFLVMGAGSLTTEVFTYYLLCSLFVFVLTLISDFRDYVGDKQTGIQTIPVRFGYQRVKGITLVMLLGVAAMILALKMFPFAILSLIAMPMAYFLVRDRYLFAHTAGIAAFIGVSIQALVI